MSDLFQTVAKIAPTLAETLIPGAPLIKSVVGMIAKAFGADEQNEEQLIQKINHDPEREAKLLQVQKEIELEFEKLRLQGEARVLENSETIAKIDADDRANARDMYKNNTDKGKKDWIPGFLVVSTVSLIIACLCSTVFLPTDSNDKDILMFLLGTLTGAFLTYVTFYFGSSKKG